MKKTFIAVLAAAALAAGCNGHPNNDKTVGARLDGLVLLRPPLESGAPEISAADAGELFKLVRMDPLKNLRDPAALRRIIKLPDWMWERYRNYVLVSVYPEGNREPLFGHAAGGNLGFSIAGAARAALGPADPEMLKTARVRIDLVYGGMDPLGPAIEAPKLRPGVEGLAGVGKDGMAVLPPELFMGDGPDWRSAMGAYVARLEKLAGEAPGAAGKGRLPMVRYRSVAVVQREAGGEAFFPYRGGPLVAEPSKKACAWAARAGLDWLAREQAEAGTFPGAYLPYSDRVGKIEASLEEQAAAALALAGQFRADRQRIVNAEISARRALFGEENRQLEAAYRRVAACEKALGFLKRGVEKDGRYGFSYVKGEGLPGVGPTALFLLILLEGKSVPGGEKDNEIVEGLAAFLLQQQTPEGEFLPRYDPQRGRAVRPRATEGERDWSGAAVLALARLHVASAPKGDQYLAAARRGANFLVAREKDQAAQRLTAGRKVTELYDPDSELMRALDILHRLGEEEKYADHLFALGDCIVAGLVTGEGTDAQDLVGALEETVPPSVELTAAKAGGLAAALRTAQRMGLREASAYERALASAAKFVVQNQFRPESGYSLPNPERAAGAFRINPLVGRVELGCQARAASFLAEWAELKREGPSLTLLPPAVGRAGPK